MVLVCHYEYCILQRVNTKPKEVKILNDKQEHKKIFQAK